MIGAAAQACTVVSPPFSWDEVEPHHCDPADDEVPIACYSRHLKANLLPGTFVLLLSPSNNVHHFGGAIVARIVDVVETSLSRLRATTPSVKVNIFKGMTELSTTETFLHPKLLVEPHLRHLPEIVQTPEIRLVASNDIVNLAFVFTMASLKDSSNLFSACQGMTIAFIVRYRSTSSQREKSEPVVMMDVPDGCCLLFPSSYQNSGYHDCYPSRIWHSLICVKLEMAKLLGRYSQQQGLYGKEGCRLSNFTPESWGFLKLQFDNLVSHDSSAELSAGASIRIRRHRISQSGLIVKAAQIIKSCTVLRFETKTHLKLLCAVFGESATAGQRCRLPKISEPKLLWQNDIINVVCGSEDCEPVFNAKTVRDGIDLEFDGCSELFITIRYSRFAYTANCLVDNSECDPLLSSVIRRCDPLQDICGSNVVEAEVNDEDTIRIRNGSEFEDHDGCVYRVASMDSTHVSAVCFYPQRDNTLYGREKSFNIQLAKELIELRLQ
jgi:hypothetical protein